MKIAPISSMYAHSVEIKDFFMSFKIYVNQCEWIEKLQKTGIYLDYFWRLICLNWFHVKSECQQNSWISTLCYSIKA